MAHRFLVDITHPAHLHFFRPAIDIWLECGHQVTIVTRDKDITLQLVEKYGYTRYACLSKMRRGMVGLGFELIEHQAKLVRVIRRQRPDVLLEVAGTFIVHAGFLTRTPSLVFYDTEHARLQNTITYPFATKVITPDCYRGDLGRKHIRYRGYQELAYLHPNRFQPDPAIVSELGLEAGARFFLLRLVSWGASHDLGQRGFTTEGVRRLVQSLSRFGTVLISSEGVLPPDLDQYRFRLPPDRIHHVMAYASLFIGEGGTMATEAALLGTPSIFVSTLESGNWYSLRDEYGLLYFFADENKAIDKAHELLSGSDLKETWLAKRAKMLEDKIDVTQFLVDLVESYVQDRA